MEPHENPVYRFCIITYPILLDIMDYESKWTKGQIRNELPKIEGPFSSLFATTLFPPFKSLRANFSLKVEQEFGRVQKDGTLTGCYRNIRDNESDFSMSFHDFPTIDYDKVDPFQVVGEFPLKILSGYHSKAEAEVSFNDFILTSIKSFDSQTWFAVLAIILAFFGVWMIKRVLFPDNEDVPLRRTIAETLWDTLLLFISQESTDYYQFMDRLLSILMTLSFFFLNTIYFGLMSTDLVSVTKPAVINSYQDIMNRPNITPVFPKVMSATKEFEDAFADQNNSIEAKFWAKYKDKVEIVDPNSNPVKLIEMMRKALDMKSVLITNELGAEIIRRLLCRFKIGNQICPNVYTWLSQDPSAKMQQKIMIMRNGMKQTSQLKALRRKIRSEAETGIFRKEIRALVKNGLQSSDQFSLPSAPHSQVERCLSDQVVYADASVDTVVLQNYYFLFSVSVVMLPASIIILLIELYCHRHVQVAI